jgi:serine kinase of HPr protein (carbohydrate metabolism regulator)
MAHARIDKKIGATKKKRRTCASVGVLMAAAISEMKILSTQESTFFLLRPRTFS